MRQNSKSFFQVSSSISTMINLASEIQRELPVSPVAFGGFAFVVFVVLLYLVLRLDRD
jgi:hypothetical protein